MIENDFGKLYIGITEKPTERLITHNAQSGALFIKGKAKFNIVFLEKYATLTEARQREIQIKKWRRNKKEMLIKRYRANMPTKLPK